MKQWFAVGTLVLAATLVGCGEKNEIKKKETVTTPHGSTTVTHKETIDKTGDHKTETNKTSTEKEAPPAENTPPAEKPATPSEPKAE